MDPTASSAAGVGSSEYSESQLHAHAHVTAIDSKDAAALEAVTGTGVALAANGDKPFADAANYLECIRYLNSTLSVHGMGAIDLHAVCSVPIPGGDSPAAAPAPSGDAAAASVYAKVSLINTVYKLIIAHQSATEYRNEQTAKYDQLFVRHSEVSSKLTVTANELHSSNHKNWVLENKKRAMESDARKLEQKLRGTIRELETRNIQIQRRDKQYIHEMRKREKEYHSLQDKVTKLLQDKNRDVKTGLELINSLKAQQLASASGRGGADVLHERTIGLYENRVTELSGENNELRASLRALQSELADALNQHGVTNSRKPISATIPASGEAEDESNANADGTAAAGTARLLGMPYRMIQNDVESGMRSKIGLLREKMTKLDDKTASPAPAPAAAVVMPASTASAVGSPDSTAAAAAAAAAAATISRLQQTIDEQRQLLSEQDALLQSALFTQSAPPQSQSTEELLRESRRWSLLAEMEDHSTASIRAAANKSAAASGAGGAGGAGGSTSSVLDVMAASSARTAQAMREAAEVDQLLIPASPLLPAPKLAVPPTPRFVYQPTNTSSVSAATGIAQPAPAPAPAPAAALAASVVTPSRLLRPAGTAAAAAAAAAAALSLTTPVRKLQFVTPKRISPVQEKPIAPLPAAAIKEDGPAPIASAENSENVPPPSRDVISSFEQMEIRTRGTITTVAALDVDSNGSASAAPVPAL